MSKANGRASRTARTAKHSAVVVIDCVDFQRHDIILPSQRGDICSPSRAIERCGFHPRGERDGNLDEFEHHGVCEAFCTRENLIDPLRQPPYRGLSRDISRHRAQARAARFVVVMSQSFSRP